MLGTSDLAPEGWGPTPGIRELGRLRAGFPALGAKARGNRYEVFRCRADV